MTVKLGPVVLVAQLVFTWFARGPGFQSQLSQVFSPVTFGTRTSVFKGKATSTHQDTFPKTGPI